MKKIKELLDDNFQGVLLVAGIAMANLVFFQQENWKMEPVKTALLSILFFFLLRIFAEQKEKSRDIREKGRDYIFRASFWADDRYRTENTGRDKDFSKLFLVGSDLDPFLYMDRNSAVYRASLDLQ